jgi:hypothetical protein
LLPPEFFFDIIMNATRIIQRITPPTIIAIWLVVREAFVDSLVDRERELTGFFGVTTAGATERMLILAAGEATGNATGEATGNATGEATGNATGEATGEAAGDAAGDTTEFSSSIFASVASESLASASAIGTIAGAGAGAVTTADSDARLAT